jgi:intergrase/recombinase
LVNRGLEIDFQRVRGDFVTFLESKRLTSRYLKSTIRYLDKYMKVIRGPMDVVRIFSGLTVGQKHNLIRGVQNLFSFLRAQGFSRDYLDVLRMNLSKDEVGFDLRLPSAEEIVRGLRVMSEACLKYTALYSLAVDSGLRLVEARAPYFLSGWSYWRSSTLMTGFKNGRFTPTVGATRPADHFGC